MERRWLLFTLAFMGTGAWGQDPRIEAVKLLLGLLGPIASDQLKKWLERHPHTKRDDVFVLYNGLLELSYTREKYAFAVKDYLANLRYGPEAERSSKEAAASAWAGQMVVQLLRLRAIVKLLATGLHIFDPTLDRNLTMYQNRNSVQVKNVVNLASMTPEQRGSFEAELDQNTMLLQTTIKDVTEFIRVNYKFDDQVK